MKAPLTWAECATDAERVDWLRSRLAAAHVATQRLSERARNSDDRVIVRATWRGVRVVVLGVSEEMKSARVEAEPDRYGRGYELAASGASEAAMMERCGPFSTFAERAEWCVAMADAMIAARQNADAEQR